MVESWQLARGLLRVPPMPLRIFPERRDHTRQRPRADELPRVPTIADLVPLSAIMTREVTCARRELDVVELAALLVGEHIGCVPVVDDGRPIGMVTKADLVEHLLAKPTEARTAGDLMMPIALALDERSTVAQAAALMACEDIHHVPVVDETGDLVGVVSSLDVVRWLARNDGFGAQVA
jgi:CBS domain-containing protein